MMTANPWFVVYFGTCMGLVQAGDIAEAEAATAHLGDDVTVRLATEAELRRWREAGGKL